MLHLLSYTSVEVMQNIYDQKRASLETPVASTQFIFFFFICIDPFVTFIRFI